MIKASGKSLDKIESLTSNLTEKHYYQNEIFKHGHQVKSPGHIWFAFVVSSQKKGNEVSLRSDKYIIRAIHIKQIIQH